MKEHTIDTIKYLTSMVTFEEIPTRVTLSLSITGCRGTCVGCHSPELRRNIGTELTDEELDALIRKNNGVNCVLFLGEGTNQARLLQLAERVRNHWKMDVALYSGRDEVEEVVWNAFDFLKIGSYKSEFGPLNNPNTNQRLYHFSKFYSSSVGGRKGWRDITSYFWRKKF